MKNINVKCGLKKLKIGKKNTIKISGIQTTIKINYSLLQSYNKHFCTLCNEKSA
jgi:hypothetical protein